MATMMMNLMATMTLLDQSITSSNLGPSVAPNYFHRFPKVSRMAPRLNIANYHKAKYHNNRKLSNKMIAKYDWATVNIELFCCLCSISKATAWQPKSSQDIKKCALGKTTYIIRPECYEMSGFL
eukprot:72372-Amphidinium_carterae.1